MRPLPVGPGDPFFNLGSSLSSLNYVVGVPTTSLSSSFSPALSPGWISDLRCSFVSGPVSCYSWLDYLDRSWTWFITSTHLGLAVDPGSTPPARVLQDCAITDGDAALPVLRSLPACLPHGTAPLLLLLAAFCCLHLCVTAFVMYSAWWKLVFTGLTNNISKIVTLDRKPQGKGKQIFYLHAILLIIAASRSGPCCFFA